MKLCKFILGALLASGAVISAQETAPRYEIGLNYSWFHVNAPNVDYQRTGNGGSGYLEFNINKYLGLVADFGGYANTKTGIDEKVLTYLFGPRFNWRHSKLSPYVQFLFGGAYAWRDVNSTTNNGFAMSSGGGLDYNFSKHIAFKPIQVEYVLTELNGYKLSPTSRFGFHQNDIRYSAGVVFRFGGE
jgi:hypothetical protein